MTSRALETSRRHAQADYLVGLLAATGTAVITTAHSMPAGGVEATSDNLSHSQALQFLNSPHNQADWGGWHRFSRCYLFCAAGRWKRKWL